MAFFGTQCINKNGNVEIGGCDTVELAREFGTPLYIMDEALIRQNCREYVNGFKSRYPNSTVAFAGKAFLTMAGCRILCQEGMSLDVVTAGELYTALMADFPMERIFFHGNFKSEAELRMALENGVGRIVVDNFQELELLNTIALEMGEKPCILLRVTPGIDPHTHRLISTGQADTKFGLNIKDGSAMKAVKRALELPGITLKGFHCHIGSQLLDTSDHTQAARIMVSFARDILDETGVAVEEINTGGGLGIRYVEGQVPPPIDQFADDIITAFKNAMSEFAITHEPRLIQEPGRSIVGTAGLTLYKVGTIKTVAIAEDPGQRTYVIIDGGMTDNPRPLLYDAVYEAIVANKANHSATETVTISGKHCETDMLIQNTRLAPVEPGDIIAVQCTGAYNYSMASNYNRMTRPAVVLVSDGKADVIVERETLEDLVAQDRIPSRLTDGC